jgi:hypothetical protein
MMRRHTTCTCVALAAVVLCGLVAAVPVHACLFSNAASAYANGVAARRITAIPTTAQERALWAPFAFPQSFARGQTLHLRENMHEVARSMGSAALHWRVHWLFGDGTRATGVAVTHTYRRRGVYRIQVQSFFVGDSGLEGWYNFDVVDIVVGPVPATLRRMIPHTHGRDGQPLA